MFTANCARGSTLHILKHLTDLLLLGQTTSQSVQSLPQQSIDHVVVPCETLWHDEYDHLDDYRPASRPTILSVFPSHHQDNGGCTRRSSLRRQQQIWWKAERHWRRPQVVLSGVQHSSTHLDDYRLPHFRSISIFATEQSSFHFLLPSLFNISYTRKLIFYCTVSIQPTISCNTIEYGICHLYTHTVADYIFSHKKLAIIFAKIKHK